MHNQTDEFSIALRIAIERWALPIKPRQIERLRAHFEAMVETNRVINLTRITKPVEAAVKHYADSLALLKWVQERTIIVNELLDIGTGAGFPAMPLAVVRPDWIVTAIDATGKKIEFLRRTAAAIGAANIRCEHAHSDHWRPGRTFDTVVCRAVTGLPRILHHGRRYVSENGYIVAYKATAIEAQEQRNAQAAAKKLGLRPHEPYHYDLRLGNERLDRVLFVYGKGAN
jgi:16S rRNA (guanine527-N7)-methyltransferase